MASAYVKIDQFEPCRLIKYSIKLGPIIKLQVHQGSTGQFPNYLERKKKINHFTLVDSLLRTELGIM